jgi:hypothetical protein
LHHGVEQRLRFRGVRGAVGQRLIRGVTGAAEGVAPESPPDCPSPAASEAWNPSTSVCFSASVSLASGWISVYWNGGISPSIASLSSSTDTVPSHSEKLNDERAPSTSRWTSHDIGAMLVAHHHSVSLLWQS